MTNGLEAVLIWFPMTVTGIPRWAYAEPLSDVVRPERYYHAVAPPARELGTSALEKQGA